MKNFKLFKLLLLGVVLITSINTAWAYTITSHSGANAYFDNTNSNWTNSVWYFGIGKDKNNVTLWQMHDVTNTKLKVVGLGNWDNADFFFISNPTNTWGATTYEHMSGNVTQTTAEYRAPVEGNYTFDDSHYYLLVPSSGSHETSFSCTHKGSSGSGDIGYFAQTVNVVVNGATPSKSPAAISITSYSWSAWDAVSQNTVSAITKGGSTKTDTYSAAAYTAKTTLDVTSISDGYYFVGWYKSGYLDDDDAYPNKYIYYPREANTIEARFENRYTVTISAGDHGTITTGSPSVTAGYYTNPTITAATSGDNASQYRFLKWVCTGGASVANPNSATTTVSATGEGTVTAQFVSVWTIKGGDTGATDNDGDEMGDWKVYNSLDYTGTSYKYRLTIDLPAKTSYRFKIYDYNSEVWYGCGTRAHDYTFAGQTDEVTFNTSPGNNIMLLTGEAGTYTFDWNSSTNKLKITYPTTPVKHPSMNYVYMEKYSDWNSGSHCYIHYWKTSGSDIPLTTWGTDDPKMTAYNNFTDKSKNFYIFPALTEYPKFRAKNNLGDASDGHDTGNQEVTGHQGHYVYYDNSLKKWTWGTFNVTINLDRQETVTTNGTTSQTVAFNDAVLSDITCPTWTGYTFGGYYNTEGCDDLQIINGSGLWIASKSGYTDASKHWIKDGSVNTLYAKWTQIMVSGISLSSTSASIYKGNTLTITPTVTPATALDRTIDWTTSNSSVATVDGGVITAVAPGTATITATAHDGSGITATCEVTVGYKVTYDDNGSTSGSVPTDATYYANGASVTVLGNTGTLAKTDYTFTCWNTQEDGYGTDYSASDTYADISDNITLYAKWTKTAYIGKYTFHYGNASTDTWTVEAFEQIDDSKYWQIEDFVIPDPDDYPNFYVGYEGWKKPAYNALGAHSWTYVATWDEERTITTHWGYMGLLPGQIKLSDGTNTAEGAVGTLKIDDDASAANCEVGFLPDGYGVAIYNGSTTRTIELKATTNKNVFETGVLNGTEVAALTSAEVGENGRYKVVLKAASGYVDCYSSTEWTVSTLNSKKLEYDTDIAAGKVGRFQVWTDYTHYNTANLGLLYTPMVNKSKSGGYGSWASQASWTLGHQPRIDEDVIVTQSMQISIDTARAKSIKIDQSGGSFIRGIQINSGAGLLVKEGITAKHSGDADFGATNQWDIYLRNDMYHNAVLICGGASDNTTATYEFYTKAYKSGSYYINQYVGIPFESMYAYQLYGFNIFVYDDGADDWRTPTGEDASTMQAWNAYNLIRQYSGSDWNNFDLDGILNLPGLTSPASQHTFTCGSRYNAGGTFDADPCGDHLFANSWSAPIEIGAIDATDMPADNFVQTIYIFNAGYEVDTNEDGKPDRVVGNAAGQWSSIPINAAKYTTSHVIPATQAFLVTSKVTNATLTLDYKKHVYDPAMDSLMAHKHILTDPLRAPKRATTMGDDPLILKITVNSGENTNLDELYIFQRSDFMTDSYDNGWDGYKLYGESYAAEIFTIRNNSRMAIDAVSDMNNTNIAFKASTQDNAYTLSFEYNDNEPLYLYDKITQEFTLINNDASYSFTTSDTGVHARFAITRSNAPQIATSYDELEAGDMMRVEKFLENDMLFIRRGGKIYNAEGILVK